MRTILLAASMLLTPFAAHAADERLVHAIIMCESSGRLHVWGDDHTSYGIAQFQQVTFNEMKHAAHMRRLTWQNPKHQVILMRWMLDHGHAARWTCWRVHHLEWAERGIK